MSYLLPVGSNPHLISYTGDGVISRDTGVFDKASVEHTVQSICLLDISIAQGLFCGS